MLSDCLTYRCLVMLQEDSQRYDFCLTYRRVNLPPSHPDDLIRPGLFQGKYDGFDPMIAVLSFHGKYARVTKITGKSMDTLKIHLMRPIQLPDGEIFRTFSELSRVVKKIDKQVFREQQQQQENGTEESEGHGWQSPAQPGVGESGAAASEEQPVPRFPGVFILFDENHLGFIGLEMQYFILFGRVQNTFQDVQAPSPQAFLEMLSNIQSGSPERSTFLDLDLNSPSDQWGAPIVLRSRAGFREVNPVHKFMSSVLC
ncbi:F-box only protein 31 [Myotis davidii]|uniref:F-box only protein 31 n=1 Tax=Myotis davidii TaxID=225400 RepID=L5M4L2_MYODS|nr:F-box only protein 31 [Myotis davidii]